MSIIDENINKTIVLHTCCAPCAGGCLEELLRLKKKVILYFSNSNLCSLEEFNKRLESVKVLANHFNVQLEVDPYNPEMWNKAIAGFEAEPEKGLRCNKCFAYNLGRTASFAETVDGLFCSSLTVSPHKNNDTLFLEGQKYSNFIPVDFKPFWSNSCKIAKELNFYRQRFCGCSYSLPKK